MWWEFPPKSIQMLERFSCLVPATINSVKERGSHGALRSQPPVAAVAVAKADQLSLSSHPVLQDALPSCVATAVAKKSPSTMTVDVFISHSSRDEQLANALIKVLEAAFRKIEIRYSSVPRYRFTVGGD
jgi:hypothetical protein